jgi:hypothetical protein
VDIKVETQIKLKDDEIHEAYVKLVKNSPFSFHEVIFDDENKWIVYRFELKKGDKMYEDKVPYGDRDIEKEKKHRLKIERGILTNIWE